MRHSLSLSLGSRRSASPRLTPLQIATELTSPTRKWLLVIDVSTSREQNHEPVIGKRWCQIPITGMSANVGALNQAWFDQETTAINSNNPPTNSLLTDTPLQFPFSSWVTRFDGTSVPGGTGGSDKRLCNWTSGFYQNNDDMPRLMANLMGKTVRLRGVAYAPASDTRADINFGLYANIDGGGQIDDEDNVNYVVTGYGSLGDDEYLDASVELPAGVAYTSLTHLPWFWIAQPSQATVNGTIFNGAGPWLEADGPGIVVQGMARSGTTLADGGHWTRTDIWPQSLHSALWPVLGSTSQRRLHLMCAGIATDASEYAANLATWMDRVRTTDSQAYFALCSAYDASAYSPAQHAHQYVAARTHNLLLVPTSESLPDYEQGRSRILAFASGGYTNCVASDVGKTVTGGTTSHTGTLVKFDNTLRTWTILPTSVSDDFDTEESITIGGGTGAGTTVSTRTLTFGATYADCVASDVGKTVTGDSTGDTGTLLYYLNVARTWLVLPDDAGDEFDEAEAVTIGSGTGAGTTLEASVSAASYGGFYSDTVHRDGNHYFTAMDQLIADAAANGNRACAISTDLSTGLKVNTEATISGIGLTIGASVSVTVNGQAWGSPTTVQSDGTWSITDTPNGLHDGNYVDVVATIGGDWSCHPRWVSFNNQVDPNITNWVQNGAYATDNGDGTYTFESYSSTNYRRYINTSVTSGTATLTMRVKNVSGGSNIGVYGGVNVNTARVRFNTITGEKLAEAGGLTGTITGPDDDGYYLLTTTGTAVDGRIALRDESATPGTTILVKNIYLEQS